MEEDAELRCWRCNFVCRNPGALANHMKRCDLECQRERHELTVREARAQEKADELAAQVEQDSMVETAMDRVHAQDPEAEERELEEEIRTLLAEQGKRVRLERAAMACTSWREQLFTPDSHVTQIKADFTAYCESGVEMAAKRMAARFNIDEGEVRMELSTYFSDFKQLGGTKREMGIADKLIEPVHPACHTRHLGTRRDNKGNMVEVFSLCCTPAH